MGAITRIEWCDHTFNAWWGCAKVPGDPACHNCYAEVLSKRYGFSIWGKSKPRRHLSDNHWKQPARWNRAAQKDGVRRRVFCSSMADVFEDRRDLDDTRARLWEVIESTPFLDWLLLTKRPENFSLLKKGLRDNVWLGTTAVTQAHYDERLPLLLAQDAAVHFVSAEPLMEPIDLKLDEISTSGNQLRWVIVGGESGGKARPCNDAWLTDLVNQCAARDVACFVKQLGKRADLADPKGGDPSEWPPHLLVRQFPLDHSPVFAPSDFSR